MAQMSYHYKSSSRYFGERLQLTNCILGSVATCHITPQVSDFIPGSLDDTDKYIEVADGNHVTAKQKVQVQIKICDINGNPFIATLHKILLAPDLCDRLFSIITLINLVHTCLFHKGFARCNAAIRRRMRLLCHIVHSGNMHFGWKLSKFPGQIK